MPYTSVNGNRTSYLSIEGKLALRLPPGVVQAEYVEVPDALLAKTAELKPFFDAGYAYVSALKPKPTAKKK